ncbi:hypothetical protein MVEG_08277 [Podila verticillata NRRL 6337]|nr:hypothetical protein MVEG_08277 [Podila verticillata NRRL 6337]
MGIPIVLPSQPSTRFIPTHSAKASWSAPQGQGPLAVDTPSSSSSSSPPSPSFRHPRPPLSSLAYVQPPPSIWGPSPSSLSPSPTRIVQSPTSFTAPSGRVEAQDSIPSTTTQGDRNPLEQDSRSLLSSLESMRSPPPRVRAHPNLRRISRVPVFITSSSLPTSLSSSSSSGRPASSPRSGSESPSNSQTSSPPSSVHQDLENNGSSPPTVPPPVWHPTSPSLVHYLTRPLPPPPSSSLLLSVQRGPENNEGLGHYINRNHPANRGRLYLDEVGRLAVDPRFRPSREEQEEGEGDNEQRRAFDRQSRSRPRPRERRRPAILTTDNSVARSSLSPPLASLLQVNTNTTTLTSPSSSSSSSSPIPGTPLSSHPAIQDYLGSRTTIQADAFQQGLIHIYPENHAPILMFGRPIQSSSAHNDPARPHRSTVTTTTLTSNAMTTATSSSSPTSDTTSASPTQTPPSN